MVEQAGPLFPYSFSLNFPEDHSNELQRENATSVISRFFTEGKNVICLEGDEGIGKTTILKQFVLAHPENTFSTFINPVRGLVSPEDFVLHDLYEQFSWFVEKKQRENTTSNIDEEKYVQMLYRVKREQKKFKNISYFVVDGLEYIDNINIFKKIIKLLPLGEPGIRVVFSINIKKVENTIPVNQNTISLASLPVYPFTLDEAGKTFDPNSILTRDDLRKIFDAANKGVPGRLRDIF